jgi:hypothetical protein
MRRVGCDRCSPGLYTVFDRVELEVESREQRAECDCGQLMPPGAHMACRTNVNIMEWTILDTPRQDDGSCCDIHEHLVHA